MTSSRCDFCNGKYNLSFRIVKLSILLLTAKNVVICKASVNPAALVMTVGGIHTHTPHTHTHTTHTHTHTHTHTVVCRFTTGLRSRIFGCKSNRRKPSII